MATSNILGLFVSPEQYQAQQLAQQQANEQARAINFANLDPRGQANYGTFLGAQQLGRGFAGLLGVQDPQLQRIRQRDQLMQSINPADPKSLMAGIQAATNAGDQELALTLTDFMNKQGSELALAAQRTAQANRERTQALPAGIQEAARIAEIERTLSKLNKENDADEIKALTAEKGRLERSARAATATQSQKDAEAYANTVSNDPDSKEWQTAYKERLDRLQLGADNAPKISTDAQKLIDAGYVPGSPLFVEKMDQIIAKGLADKEDRGVSFGTDREAIAEEFFEKPFKDLTKDQKAKVNSVKEDREGTVAQKGATKFVMPGETKPVDILTFRKTARDTLAPYVDTIDNGDSALAALKNARTPDGKTNPSSFTQGVAYLASMAQSGRLSNKDVELVKEDPAVLRSLGNYISTKWEGVPLQPTIDEITKTVKIIRKVAKAKYDRELAAQRKLADLAGIPPNQRDALFEDMSTPPAGDSKVVPWNQLKK